MAFQKIRRLSLFTKNLTVLAPKISGELRASGVRCLRRTYHSSCLDGFSLVYACTDLPALNLKIRRDANRKGIPVNVVDDPGQSDFGSPALDCRGSMTVAVHSDGRDAARSVAWRNKIAGWLDRETALCGESRGRRRAKVFLVGFGPGDPGLLTFRAEKVLRDADIIFYDDLIDAGAIERYRAQKVYVGKRGRKKGLPQERINELLSRAARRYRCVVRLKGGDPFVFGRGGEELTYLRSKKIHAEVIPGITAALAAASDAGIPLTQRAVSSSVAFCVGHPEEKICIPNTGTAVYYMAGGHTQVIAKKFLSRGWDPKTPVAFVIRASLKGSRVLISALGRESKKRRVCPSPFVMIVGETISEKHRKASLRRSCCLRKINSFRKKSNE